MPMSRSLRAIDLFRHLASAGIDDFAWAPRLPELLATQYRTASSLLSNSAVMSAAARHLSRSHLGHRFL
jgi:hypothetical protein